MLVRPVIFRAPDSGGGTGTVTADPPAGGDGGTGSRPPATDGGDGDGDLGSAGQQALEAFKQRARAAEKESKELKARLATLEQQTMSDSEKAVAAARDEAARDTATKYTSKLLDATIENIAGGKFATPSLAVKLVDRDGLLDDEGEPNRRRITTAIDAVLKDHPELAAGPQNTNNFDGGARRTTRPANDMSAMIRRGAGYA